VQNITALKLFLREKKKFSNMLMDEKTGLTHKGPLDFYNHLAQFVYPNVESSFRKINAPHYLYPVFPLNKISVYASVLDGIRILNSKPDLIPSPDAYVRSIIVQCRNVIRETKSDFMKQVFYHDTLMILKYVQSAFSDLIMPPTQSFIDNMMTDMRQQITFHYDIMPLQKNEVSNLPLLWSHPFDWKDFPDTVQLTGADWEPVMLALSLGRIKITNLFDLHTLYFRNSCIRSWNVNPGSQDTK
jgi:hypothetical protein